MATRLPDPHQQSRRRSVAKVGSWLERAFHLVASGQTVGPAIQVVVLAVTASLLSLWRQLAWPWRVLLFISAAFLVISLVTAFRRVIALRRRAAAGEAVPPGPDNQFDFAFVLQQGSGTMNLNDNLMTVDTRSVEQGSPRPSAPEERQALGRDLLALSRELTRVLDEHEGRRDQISAEYFNEIRRRAIEAKRGSGEGEGRVIEPFDLSAYLQEESRQLMSRYRADLDRHVAKLYEDARAIDYQDVRLEVLYRYPHVGQFREMAQRLGVIGERLIADR
jgi:hypothetical protein